MPLKTSLTGSWPPTYDLKKGTQHLPTEEQERIVQESIKKAIQNQLEPGASFKLTKQSFESLKKNDIPDTILEGLKTLENQEFTTGKEEFVRAVREHIGEEPTSKYKDLIVKHAQVGVDILVDGQVRNDFVSLFAQKLPGIEGSTLPYQVVKKIQPLKEPITVADYEYAKKLVGEKPLKAHITGPMTIARVVHVETESYTGRNDPKLIRDIARTLGQEAKFLVEAGAEIVQIDEVVLTDGVNLQLAFDAINRIIEIGEIPLPALHVCGNVTKALDDILTQAPVKIVSIEGWWLRYDELSHIDSKYLSKCGKQIGLGCIRTNNYGIERLTKVETFLDEMRERFGEEFIWAVMPNCGFRPVPYEIAQKKLEVMVRAARSIK